MTDVIKDTDHPTYPHLENLDRVPYVLDAPEVWITEKIHGFNARFGWTRQGEIWAGSRNQVVYRVTDSFEEGVPHGLQGFVEWSMSVVHRLYLGVTVFGEWAGKGIQKGIDYGEKRFYLFGMMEDGEFLHPSTLIDWAERLDCLAAPLIYGGKPPTPAELLGMRTSPSELADGDKEGVVIVPWPPIFDQYGHRVIGKWKNEGFEERAKQPRPDREPVNIENVKAFVDQYATPVRLEHVLDQVQEIQQHLTVEQVATDNRFMGDILRAFYQDVVREGEDDFNQLSADDQKMVGKVLNPAVKDLLESYRYGLLVSSTETSANATAA